ncbi:hypothetical protein DRN76_04065 [Methanosarcinales archaeon]|nr:MAG: hypothetical protein DRN76_04065 [Methanosarcinales archaeon]
MPAYEELESEVIESGICSCCGACIASCPLNHLQWINGTPKRPEKKDACKDCETCYHACYKTGFNESKIEEMIFGRKRREEEVIGIYRNIFEAKANDKKILSKSQDGGIVTAILSYALNTGIIDGAILAENYKWKPEPTVATTFDGFVEAAGTKYGTTPNLMKIRTAVIDHALDRVCVVGTPCHIRSIKYLQYINFELYPAITLVVGLFCRENFEYEKMRKRIEQSGVDITEITKISVSKNFFNAYTKENRLSFPITEIGEWVPKHCLICEDYTSELADISVGCEGSGDGWSTVIIRTETGEKIFSGLERSGVITTKTLGDLDHIKEVSVRKRRKAEHNRETFKLKEDGYGVKKAHK